MGSLFLLSGPFCAHVKCSQFTLLNREEKKELVEKSVYLQFPFPQRIIIGLNITTMPAEFLQHCPYLICKGGGLGTTCTLEEKKAGHSVEADGIDCVILL